MEALRELLDKLLTEGLLEIIMSNPREEEFKKCSLRPLEIKGCLAFQETRYKGKQVFHRNLTKDEAKAAVMEMMENSFRQLEGRTAGMAATVLVSKKGKVTVKTKKRQEAADKKISLNHNRKKNYILEEGKPVDFLVDLGVMNAEGKVLQAYFHKFRQINRFLEFVEDILPALPTDREVSVIDFGCGKSYLTFALYYYLKELRGYDIRITGLDLKADVIAHCNRLKDRYGYTKLNFLVGDIGNYNGTDSVDMVVTLHACDTATDMALAKAVGWGAKVILSVPCCQHELNRTINNPNLQAVLQFGLLKERMAALATDGMRAELLKTRGYEMQVLEFIDMEHTPKNILLRGVYTGKKAPMDRYLECKAALNAELTLEKLLDGQREKEWEEAHG